MNYYSSCHLSDERSIPNLQKRIHEWAVRKEWRGPNAETQRTTGDDIALIVSEAAEALEAFREVNCPTERWFTYDVIHNGVKFKNLNEDQVHALDPDYKLVNPKPEGVGPELADLLIRVFDYAEHVGLDMEWEVLKKMEHNELREVRHGGKHL